ncbi:uncharacterized protein L969DRAFT_64913 [Mixia osmundae IAM 14324]|uniref:RCC1-like domain-containing protein n=1 Tax=Mixia osmundae (strain CBS 9802 / IAM 14324 / JCM 22182 / KY 12970) TaxID=764103 RepID=G7DX07_MIXOS|nr:uncharacterized protein L969DRAFT_64913 [Mixia osmundae IAM 14324]KEI38087.1 hypothetical protein L969DRAFT_64913 [Mixia osmundae IAM 14324]GAA95104.1 hypothetical protein E5Q_01759 [Mixia osmundae IAM 14324]
MPPRPKKTNSVVTKEVDSLSENLTSTSLRQSQRGNPLQRSSTAADVPSAPVASHQTNGALNKHLQLPGNSQSSLKRSASAVSSVTGNKRRAARVVNAIPHQAPAELSPAFSFEASARPSATQTRYAALVCGAGDSGQLGLGTADNATQVWRPRLHALFEKLATEGKLGPSGLADIAVGGFHTIATDSEGKVWSWGANDNAALGRITAVYRDRLPDEQTEEGESGPRVDQDATAENEFVPMVVTGLSDAGFKAVSVAAGDSISLAVSDQGELKAWGSFRAEDGSTGFDGVEGHPTRQFSPVTIAMPSPCVSVAAGDNHVVALLQDGTVASWGVGQQAQLGRKIMARRTTNGLRAEGIGLKNIIAVGAGSFHSFALDESGKVYGWGLNTFQQLGLSDKDGGLEDSIGKPTVIEALLPDNLNGAKVVAMSGGEHHSLFLLDDGRVFACGRCDDGQCGLSDAHEAMINANQRQIDAKAAQEAAGQKEEERIASLEASGSALTEVEKFNLTMTAKMTVSVPNKCVPYPTAITFPGEERFVQIAAGARQALAVADSGALYGFGLNGEGQLGLGEPDDEPGAPQERYATPTKISNKALTTRKVLRAASGTQHSALLAVDL